MVLATLGIADLKFQIADSVFLTTTLKDIYWLSVVHSEVRPESAFALTVQSSCGGVFPNGKMQISVPRVITKPPIHIQTTRGRTRTLRVA